LPGTEILEEVTDVDSQKRCHQNPFGIDFHLETAYNPFMTKQGYPIGQTNQHVPIDTYIQNVNKLFLHGKETDHSYRSDLHEKEARQESPLIRLAQLEEKWLGISR
jgi:hypothetical protein